MTQNISEKHFDVRTMKWYEKKGTITKPQIEEHLKNLPNDENNFDLVMIGEDDIGIGNELSDDEIKAMPAMTEENIDNFDFMNKAEDTQNSDQKT